MIPPSSFPKGPKAVYSDDCTLGKVNKYHTLGELLNTVSELISVPRETNVIMALPVWVVAYGGQVINGVLAIKFSSQWTPVVSSPLKSELIDLAIPKNLVLHSFPWGRLSGNLWNCLPLLTKVVIQNQYGISRVKEWGVAEIRTKLNSEKMQGWWSYHILTYFSILTSIETRE